jgi:uncharacterized C2H2 Zn-finger protein
MDKRWLILPVLGLVGYGIYRLVRSSNVPGGDQRTLTIQAGVGGTTNPAPGSHSYQLGYPATITAIPASGYVFTEWIGSVHSTANPLTLTMNVDMTIHAGFTPSDGGGDEFTCTQCGATFPTQQALNDHIVLVHGGSIFVCGQCGATFTSQELLNQHVASAHSIPVVTVTFRAVNYGPRAQYWVVMPFSVTSAFAIPITQPFVYTIPANDLTVPNLFIVDMYDGEPTYGVGQSLRGQAGYPNLGQGMSCARNLINGETLEWVGSPNGWWRDSSGNWV